MARGIELPTRAVNGRLKMLEGDEYIEQLVFVALGDNDTENPFLIVGLGQFMLFAVNDANAVEGEIRKRVRTAFRELERDQLAKLYSTTFRRDGAEKILYLEYTNLETGQRRELEVPLGDA